jgi:formylglycine-generating enzyme required for sulfatase activity
MTLVALLHAMQGQLPASRVVFYDQLIDLCLVHWTDGRTSASAPEASAPGSTSTETRDLRQAFDLEALQATIAKSTYDRYARLNIPSDLVELSTSELRAALVQVVRDGRMEAVDALITRMRTRPALLVERRADVHVYAHSCLQAHAAAYHLAVQPDLPQLALSLAREDYARWRDVILLAGTRLAELGESLPAALELADAFCRSHIPDAGQKSAPDIAWQLAWLAGEMLAEIAQEIDMPKPMQTIECVEAWLVALLERGQLTPLERAKAGSVLDRLPDGDRRPGVSSPNLLWCPVAAGDFWQGEGQATQAKYVGAFWMSRYPITNAQYAAFVQATASPPPGHWQGDHPPAGMSNHPVVQLTWKQATQYCVWYTARLFSEPFLLWRLDQAEKLARVPDSLSRDWVVRLPTSQEWEKAARGGLQIPADHDRLIDNPLPHRTYPWSDNWQFSAQGAKGDETRCNVSESHIGATTPVGMYPDGASPYGLMDLAGNVWEWCLDWADEQNHYKVRRGGAYRFTHEHARCAAHDQAHPGLGWPHLGFRVVLAAPKP